MIFNLNVVQRIIRHCSCPNVQFEEDEPDDIFLGICLYKLKIPVIHTRRLHQVIHYLFVIPLRAKGVGDFIEIRHKKFHS